MPVVWSERCLLHEPLAEIWIGMRTPAAETPDRARAILRALDARVVDAEPHPDEPLLAVHDESLLAYLASAWDEWEDADLEQDRVVPYVFAHRELGVRRAPTATWAKPGWFAYDTMTLVGPGTWHAARAAADATLTAVDLVLGGEPVAYACTRPPGHHVTRSAYGGSCYLNNAAIAAAALHERLDGVVAVVDVDAHHGNGTQEIFRGRGDVGTGSTHVDPGAGWFPHFLGFAEESDASNLNLPLAPDSGDGPWLEAVAQLARWAEGAAGLVLALGVDAAADDPESPLEVTPVAFREAGRLLGALELPTVVVQEGGYHLATLGPLVREVLLGLEEGRG
jgi:acetoin utilization deacetylase AcuC-like enzyme